MSALTGDRPVLIPITDPEEIREIHASHRKTYGEDLPIPPAHAEYYKKHNIT